MTSFFYFFCFPFDFFFFNFYFFGPASNAAALGIKTIRLSIVFQVLLIFPCWNICYELQRRHELVIPQVRFHLSLSVICLLVFCEYIFWIKLSDFCFRNVFFQNVSQIYFGCFDIWSCLSDCNWTRTKNDLVCKRTLNYLAKLAKWHDKNIQSEVAGCISHEISPNEGFIVSICFGSVSYYFRVSLNCFFQSFSFLQTIALA